MLLRRLTKAFKEERTNHQTLEMTFLSPRANYCNKKEMPRSPVPLLFWCAILVPIGRSLLYDKNGSLLSMTVNPTEALPNETTFSPEAPQLQQVPRSTSSVPNDIVTWTEFRSILAIVGALIVLFLTALCVESEQNPELYRRLRYPSILCLGHIGIFALFGVAGRQSSWSTIGGSVILVLIVLLAVQIFCSPAEVLLLPKYEAIFYLHAFFGYVALLCVGIASYFGAACLNGYDWFIFGGAFLCFFELVAIFVHRPSSLRYPTDWKSPPCILPKIVALYGYVLIVYLGILGNLSLVGFDGKFAVLSAAVFVFFWLLILFYCGSISRSHWERFLRNYY
uniref:Cytochrome b561 domain-containing protein n=1 Tax=Globodera rostochiensis TaxID=31243 RepID=A0A914HGW0_GLORO